MNIQKKKKIDGKEVAEIATPQEKYWTDILTAQEDISLKSKANAEIADVVAAFARKRIKEVKL